MALQNSYIIILFAFCICITVKHQVNSVKAVTFYGIACVFKLFAINIIFALFQEIMQKELVLVRQCTWLL